MRKFLLIASFILTLTVSARVSDLPSRPPAEMILTPEADTQPEIYIKSGIGLMHYEDRLDALPSDGSLTKIIRDGDKIYMGNVFSWFETPGWIEGTISGNTATFQLPQLVNQVDEDINGIIVRKKYYAVMCDLVVWNGNGDMVPTAEQVFTLTINEDGTIEPGDLQGVNDPFLCSWTYSDYTWEWSMDGDSYISLSPLTLEPHSQPESVTFSPMVITYPHILYGGKYATTVEAGFDGDDCYLRGIATNAGDLENTVIKGSRRGDMITFDSNQYLGANWNKGFTQYFIAGETEYEVGGSLGYYPIFSQTDTMEFMYDEVNGCLKSDMSFILAPSPQEESENLYFDNIYNTPEIYPINEDGNIKEINSPEVVMYSAPAYGYPHIIDFVGSMVSTDNQLLDMSKLYFQLLIDGKPFEFTPEMDPALKEGATLIPFLTDDRYCFVAFENIYQMVAFPESVEFNSLYLRFIYDPFSENPVYSKASYVAGDPNSVSSISDEEESGAAYSDLMGLTSREPKKGINIRRTRRADGTIKTSKLIIK